MSPRSVPLATLLSVVPYFHSRGAVPVAEAARDLGLKDSQLRDALWQLWSCGLPGYGPGDLIDLAFSAEDLDEAELVEVTFTAGIDRPVRLTAAEAVTLETGLAVFLDRPEVVDQAALRDLLGTLRAAAGGDAAPARGVSGAGHSDADLVRTAVRSGRALRFVYHSASSDSSTIRVVDPARLSVADGHSYIHGVDRGSGAWRTFRTDRMSRVEDMGPRRAVGPEPQDDDDNGDRLIERAIVPAAGAWFLDEFGFHSVRRRPDGDLDVEIAYFDRAWLVRFLLGHADVVTPVDPELARVVAERAVAGLAAYADSTPDHAGEEPASNS